MIEAIRDKKALKRATIKVVGVIVAANALVQQPRAIELIDDALVFVIHLLHLRRIDDVDRGVFALDKRLAATLYVIRRRRSPAPCVAKSFKTVFFFA